jgi:hypothetical protein
MKPPAKTTEKPYLVIIYRALTETSLYLEGKIVPRRPGKGMERQLKDAWDWADVTGLGRAKATLQFRLDRGCWPSSPEWFTSVWDEPIARLIAASRGKGEMV